MNKSIGKGKKILGIFLHQVSRGRGVYLSFAFAVGAEAYQQNNNLVNAVLPFGRIGGREIQLFEAAGV